MAVLKCKMCGGTIEFKEGATVGVCESCGTKQTFPRLDDERKASRYDKASNRYLKEAELFIKKKNCDYYDLDDKNKASNYNIAIQLIRKGDILNLEKGIKMLGKLGDYKESKDRKQKAINELITKKINCNSIKSVVYAKMFTEKNSCYDQYKRLIIDKCIELIDKIENGKSFSLHKINDIEKYIIESGLINDNEIKTTLINKKLLNVSNKID